VKGIKTIFIAAVVLLLCACPAHALIEFKDGLTHDIDYQIIDYVYVDSQTPYMYTTVNWLAGAHARALIGCEHSRINILGGSVGFLESWDFSQVDISGGSIEDRLDSWGSSQLNISGGFIYGLVSWESSHADISGGSIGDLVSSSSGQINVFGGTISGDLRLWGQSKIRIFGYDFAVDGQPLGYGELTSIYGGLPDYEPLRHLTGTLLSGELFDNDFYIGNDARIVLIPEPTTLLLLGIGGLVLRKRRRSWHSMLDSRYLISGSWF